MRILGIDYGTKRVGVAIGDTESRIAVPLCVLGIKDLRFKIKEIVRIVKEEDVKLVLIGQGGKGPIEKKVQNFAAQLRKHVAVQIVDEHFTTAQIERVMKGYGKARKGVDKDSAAAALILQAYLDQI